MSGGGGGGDSTLRLGRDAMAPNPGYLKLLGEFGFPHDLACKALMAVHNESLNAAIEWLDAHRDQEDVFEELPTAEQPQQPYLGPPAAAVSPAPASAASNEDLRADGISRSKLEAERRDFNEFKRQKQMAEEREKLKKKEEAARVVRENYAREKAQRLAKKDAPAPTAAAAAAAAAVPRSSPTKAAAGPVAIQIRVPNRSPLAINDLDATSTLADLYARVDAAVPNAYGFVLTVPFPPPPKHLARSDAAAMARTLAELGLTPRAALMLTEEASLGKVAQGHAEPAAAAAAAVAVVAPVGAVRLGGGNGVDLARTVESRYLAKPDQRAECSICQGALEDGERIRTLPCMHVYHGDCLEEWVVATPTCPQCPQ